jgi:hypothetical protein
VGGLEKACFPEEEDKDILHEIVSLGIVPQNSAGDAAYHVRVTVKQLA